MADPFVAEVRIFPFNFAPQGWAWCDGQILPLAQNTALFSLLGTTFGGDGKNNFALPDLQGRAPMHAGQGPGLPAYSLGQSGGYPTVGLLETEIPVHTHPAVASSEAGTQTAPTGQLLAGGVGLTQYAPPGSLVPLSYNAIGVAGQGVPHNNMQPFVTLYFCIALQGIFPPRSDEASASPGAAPDPI